MEGKLTKEFMHRILTSNCIRDESIIFNAIRFTLNKKKNTIGITLIKDSVDLVNYEEPFTEIADIGSVTFNIEEGLMKIILV